MELILSQNEIPQLLEILDLPKRRGIYLLSGTLASGKTTLIQAMVKTLGIEANVTSPTYLTALEYGHGVYHYDIYQKDLNALFALGFLEEIEKEGWHFIEWGDENLAKILKGIGLSFCRIVISLQGQKRKYTIEEY
ncbi:tRNA (adenosine(37)-N6)-threonylcarbamoyltransferase complex ATPase subunit type 1 TsaE [Helicobacter turcicus]|uniref:tRNA threonylcarbamoyladenosine biosynthesis protein TsaE n=1 Tax=Helicobacter turcicus TaxID=2867412 RepID=A0ABS7JMM5_9HELI|nr:tRNA (adenosine(37)-N6)-threonylcarbamoyltransferase complex ATPase subunit type 1 TsaE [Helicobacter turcicus]MBX7490649.1 tRNA (adenosine(37)-N6)-threonylcarbamoyltransferase complex ATPase subunit type 1 TsaE [Helicobacter turcicus]MBX7545443.1 tRNA (adenosine(37)-N6)-threonylcarbamoyltransferase complex ATPase subunit type 1 TsaE [Helicobacter turcicus]